MKAEERLKLERILASFDEPGLLALANKGLVRRAQKDLEAGGLEHEETDAAILVRGPGWVVIMPPDGPARATDDTPASGMTRQILTATIYLRDHWAAGTPPSPAQEDVSQPAAKPEAAAAEVETLVQALLELTPEDLRKWAGKTTVKEVLPLLTPLPELEVETHAGLTIRLVRHEVEARLLPVPWGKSSAKLLDAILSTAPKAQHKRWVVATVLAFQMSRGLTPQLLEPAAAPEFSGAPLSRDQVLASTQDLLGSMVATGLAHPSERMLQRLFTLSVSATAVNLPRLSRLLRSLSDDVSLVLARNAAADTGLLWDRLGLTFALARALAKAGAHLPRGLVGQNRTEYDPAGNLHLAGVGAYPWRTASGYEGVSVLFWDLAGKRFLTWTTSRPVANRGLFSLEGSYRNESVWAGGGPPERLSRTCFTLEQARLNALGRLSGSQQTSVSGSIPTAPGTIDFANRVFRDWRVLIDYARTTYPLGLAEKNPLDRIVVLQPAAWGERFFDEHLQRFCWRLKDATGRSLLVALSWTGVNEASIEMLESVKPERDKLRQVICRIDFGNKGLLPEPLALLSQGAPNGQCVLNPGFDRGLIGARHSDLLARLRKKHGRDRISTASSSDEGDENDADHDHLDGLPAGLRNRLSEVESLLLQVAESGLRRLGGPTLARFRQVASELDRAGLSEIGKALGEFERSGVSAAHLLGCGYLARLHRQAARLAGGIAWSATAG